ncbi:cysteine-rich motor neuron 1 protein-like [Strongylocentrotus purpuratus]|uniref:VWFC domain-containing protein n=1 Tax=Strongylocentrotus purpuratus TaxID=7668 RepID=A0A7M7PUK0_STRPU|nr:cysteine-rich motor neuron 1 protein-like [Strongylocentrotus purpuratus]
MMMNRSWYLVCLVFVSLVIVVHHASSQESISISSGIQLLPCIYHGVPFVHSEVWRVDECTTCTCDNSTTTCVVESCQPAHCTEHVKPPGECCSVCPYDVTVRKVEPTIQTKRNVTTNGDATIVLAADVTFKDAKDTSGVRGESLWELSAWIAPVNTTHRIGFTEQVLNVDQASQWYVKGNRIIFLDVVYTFVAPSLNCDEANVCVELKRGRNAVTTDGRPFNFGSDPDSSTSLIGCTSLCAGRDIFPCVDTEGIHLHEDVWQRDPCTHCTCNNGTAACSTKECPDPGCNRPVRLKGECCLSCPYHVRVRRVSPFVMAQDQIGDQVHLRVLITFHESQHTTNVTGINLWKLSAWVALDQTKTGKRYDYREQILDATQRSQQYVKGETPAFAVDLGIADTAVVCGTAFYICVRFDIDSNYQTEHDRGFEFSGLPDNSSLIGCTSRSTTIPEERCSTVDQPDESPVKSDVWIPLVISTIVHVVVVIIVLAIVYLRRRKIRRNSKTRQIVMPTR